ncbi:MAG: enoyl-CoA hydratase/isomerase family protein [Gaiellaceae bacterium]
MPVPELVTVRREGPVCVLTLDRPDKLNALSTAVERELLEALGGEEVGGSRCVVLAGAGRAFSAGADLTEVSRDDPAGIAAYYRDTGDVYERFAALPQPTIAALHGYCLGGGLELALAADFRVADETAVLGLPEVALGIVPSSGGLHRLVRIVGPARAKEAMLLRERLGAREALALGLVTEVVAEGAALERALELAGGIASLPPLAVSVAKQAADILAESSREAGVAVERLAYGMLAQTDEARAAAEGFARRKG